MVKEFLFPSFVVLVSFLMFVPLVSANTYSIGLEKEAPSQWLYTADSKSLSDLGNFTFEAWIKLKSLPDLGESYNIINKWQPIPDFSVCGDECNEYEFRYRNVAGTYQLMGSWNGSGSAPTSQWDLNIEFKTDVWIHVASTCDVSVPSCLIYVDSISYPAHMSFNNAVDTRDTDTGLAIGNNGTTTGDDSFDGLMDEVRVWDDVRTAEEIADNYMRELNGDEENLVGYWKFNRDYLDGSGNGNDLTPVNDPLFSNDVPFGNEPDVNLTDSLVSYWELEETTGVRMDSHGMNHLLESSSVGSAVGKQGIAADFERTDSAYLSIADKDQSGLDIDSSISVSLWTKMEDISQPQIFVHKYHGNDNQRAYAFYWDPHHGGLTACLSEVGSVGNCKTQPYAFAGDTWYHVAFTWDSAADTGRMFVNGSPVGTDLAYGISTIYTNNEPFYLGTNEYIETYDGVLDEIGIWNRALTRAEIEALYNGGSGVSYENLSGSDEELSLEELLITLIDRITTSGLEKNMVQAYMAHVKKVGGFVDNGQYEAALNQMDALVKKVEKDHEKGRVEDELYEEFTTLIEAITRAIESRAVADGSGDEWVPLITQVVSPYPSIAETSAWAEAVYASGTAQYAGGCGATIRQCGCVISSLSMLGRSYGIERGVDGSEVNPLNMNNWLVKNNGYTAKGSLYWAKALQYLGEKDGETINTHFTHDAFSTSSRDAIHKSLAARKPVIAFSRVPGGYNHYYIVDEKLSDTYSVRDPFWFNTETTNDVRDVSGHIQDYDNTFVGAQLFSYHKKAKPLASLIEVHLASPAHLVLTDGMGRRLGYDPIEGMEYREIPGGQYGQIAAHFSGSGAPAEPAHHEKVLYLPRPDSSPYELTVIGTDSGEYTLSTLVIDAAGRATTSDTVALTEAGKIDVYGVPLPGAEDGRLSELYRLAAKLPDALARKVTQMLEVIGDKVEKENSTPTQSIAAAVIGYLEQHAEHTPIIERIVLLLQAL